jgi:hypothetical protein
MPDDAACWLQEALLWAVVNEVLAHADKWITDERVKNPPKITRA